MDEHNIITYLRDAEEFYQTETLSTFIEGLAQYGNYVAGEDRREVGAIWMATLNKEPVQADAKAVKRLFTPGISPALRRDIEVFVRDRSSLLAIYLFSTARSGDLQAFEATIYLEPEEHSITLSMRARAEVPAPFLHWLDILQFTYETWHPLYAYNESAAAQISYEEALTGNVQVLCQLNLWNREMVERLGQERFASLPVWKKSTLADGSVFVVVRLLYNGGRNEDYAYDTKRAAAHLGLSAS